MPRIQPLAPPFEPDVDGQLARMMPPDTPPIALFRIFAKNMPMTRAMHGWGSYELGPGLSLSLRDREIVIDRTYARTGWSTSGVCTSCSSPRVRTWTAPRSRPSPMVNLMTDVGPTSATGC